MVYDFFYMYTQEFIASLAQEKKVSAHTQKAYKRDLKQLASFWQETKKPSNARQIDGENSTKPMPLQKVVEKFFAMLAHKGITPSSIARKISCLSSFKKYLKKRGIILPIELKRPLVLLKDPLSLPLKEAVNVLDLVKITDLPTPYPYRDKALIELIYSTGITCAEIVSVEIKHVDFTSQTILIRSKKKKERVVPFNNQSEVCIRAYLENERPFINSPHETLFLNHRRKPLTPRSVQRVCIMFRELLGKRRIITPQVLRSSYAAHQITQGTDIEVVQELLGHKTRISTERYKKVRIAAERKMSTSVTQA